MLEKQTEMMKLRRRILRSKLRTEQLKQTLIQNKLAENLVQLPEMEPSSESSSSEDGEEV